jgi:hypothetical protein
MKKILTTSLIAASLAATASLHGAALIYESFSQATGSLDGATASSTGLAGTWSQPDGGGVIEAESLSYGNLAHSGNQATIPSAGSVESFATTTSVLGDNNLLDNGATLWFSTMFLKANTTAGTNEHSGFALGSATVAPNFDGVRMSGDGIGFYTQGTGIRAATWLTTGKQNSVSGATFETTDGASVFLVGKIEWGALAGDVHTITLYNPSTSDLGTLGTGISTTVSHFDQSAMNTVSFAQRNSGNTQTYDEIRFGAAYADVSPVPEPGSFALISGCLALTSIMLRRRRD